MIHLLEVPREVRFMEIEQWLPGTGGKLFNRYRFSFATGKSPGDGQQ